MHFYIVKLRKEYRFLNSTGVAMSSFANAIKLILIVHLITIYPGKKIDKSTVAKKRTRQDNVSNKTSCIRFFYVIIGKQSILFVSIRAIYIKVL